VATFPTWREMNDKIRLNPFARKWASGNEYAPAVASGYPSITSAIKLNFWRDMDEINATFWVCLLACSPLLFCRGRFNRPGGPAAEDHVGLPLHRGPPPPGPGTSNVLTLHTLPISPTDRIVRWSAAEGHFPTGSSPAGVPMACVSIPTAKTLIALRRRTKTRLWAIDVPTKKSRPFLGEGISTVIAQRPPRRPGFARRRHLLHRPRF